MQEMAKYEDRKWIIETSWGRKIQNDESKDLYIQKIVKMLFCFVKFEKLQIFYESKKDKE